MTDSVAVSDLHLDSFRSAVNTLDRDFAAQTFHVADDNVEVELHTWLDGVETPLPWADPATVTADEWFFITTLYGQMTLSGQRTHIRHFFGPLFVQAARREIRNFVRGLPEYQGLLAPWMPSRLCTMGAILRERGCTMADYVNRLRELERRASLDNPMPALDAIIRDHRATGWKTLSVFVRDCVKGNCFLVDSRVQNVLRRYGLPADERLLVSLCLTLGRNPREVARMFFGAGGGA